MNGDEVGVSRPVGYYPSSTRPNGLSPRRNRKCLILSQSMVIDIDPTKVCELVFCKFPCTHVIYPEE
jgi:hypothetical protein